MTFEVQTFGGSEEGPIYAAKVPKDTQRDYLVVLTPPELPTSGDLNIGRPDFTPMGVSGGLNTDYSLRNPSEDRHDS